MKRLQKKLKREMLMSSKDITLKQRKDALMGKVSHVLVIQSRMNCCFKAISNRIFNWIVTYQNEERPNEKLIKQCLSIGLLYCIGVFKWGFAKSIKINSIVVYTIV